MGNNNSTVEHTGIVKRIYDNSMIVGIISNSGCISCQSKEFCNMAESDEKEIELNNFDKTIAIGEKVMVYFKESLGFRALFLGYVLPFMLVLSILIVITSLGFSELIAGLVGLVSLVPYYLIIYLVNSKLKKTFSFSVKRMIPTSDFNPTEKLKNELI